MSKIRVLIIFANPRNTNPLRLGTEDRAIQQAIRRSRYRDKIELMRCHAATIHDVRQALLDEDFEIVHIAGHGSGEGLALEDEIGNFKVIPQRALAALFKEYCPPLQCVILNACYSLSQGRLISHGVPFTIAMEGSVDDEAAIAFSRGFYDAIGAGRSIDFAYREGCRTVALAAPGTSFVSKMLKSRTKQIHSSANPAYTARNKAKQEPSLSSNVVLIDASLDFHDSPYVQTIEKGRKVIQYRRQDPPALKVLTAPAFQTSNPNWIDVNALEQHITIKNVSTENMYNIYAALFGCETYIVPQTMPQQRMNSSLNPHWRDDYSGPLEPGETYLFILKSRGNILQGYQKIGSNSLYAPQEPSLYDLWHSHDLPFHSARLTLTYRDTSEHKYVQVFDYDHYKRAWTCQSRPTLIQVDLYDIK